MRDRYERLYKDMLQEGIEKGELVVDNVTISSRALLQMCTGISYWYNPEGPLSIKEIADSYVDLFFHGVCGNVAN